ncbi:lipase family protein [Corynebacterium sp. TAE3-ERU12]|uniref:lipase family protein n=1 Tax=Corynebacterium sp. TAE3-ERU12 TaxID=2849491 RepID=UPI001C465B7C|nr:lipase family protein [Corynebacterium sp. TAE3-ERU12]MBV7294984.1 lipase family protein [Corynebacterium sp. TAE3-ERU12]
MKQNPSLLAAACAVAMTLSAAGPAAAAPAQLDPFADPWTSLGEDIANTDNAALPGPFGQAPGSDTGSLGSSGLGRSDELDNPFYTEIPDALGSPGTVLKTEPADQLLSMGETDWPGTATRIMYTSTRQNGQLAPVTGFVIDPVGDWEGKGPRPTVVLAPGTMGQGDQCAPSRGKWLLGAVDAEKPSLNFNYELLTAYVAASKGMRVVVTDYIGLGTPGVHTYVNSDDEGHAVLDAARAALILAGADADDPVGLVGYSQGGGAAAAAAERAASYAPDVNLKATYAGAPPANLRKVLHQIDGNAIVGAIGYALNSGIEYLEDDVDVDVILDRFLNDEGKRFLETTQDQCIVDSVAMWGTRTTDSFTTDGSDFAAVLDREPVIAEIIDSQQLGLRDLNAPMTIATGVNDDAIPTGQVRELAQSYCARGGHVAFRPDEIPSILSRSALNHIASSLYNTTPSVEYLVDAFNGEQLPNDCGSF